MSYVTTYHTAVTLPGGTKLKQEPMSWNILAIVAKLSFSPYLPNSPVSPTFMGPLIALCFALLAIVAKLSFSPYLPNLPVSPTFVDPLTALCFALLAIVAKLSFFPYIFAKFASIANFYGPPYCFLLCPIGDCGKNVILAIFAKSPTCSLFCHFGCCVHFWTYLDFVGN